MMKALSSSRQQMRERITQLAARLMAEDGIEDYAQAKRKAARQMGASDTHNLPSNNEIEQALRAYQALYQKEEQHDRLYILRSHALQAMQLLAQFNPYLTGPVLTGTAVRHTGVDLQLFTENLKEVEHFLINQQIPYKSGQRRFRFGDAFRDVPTFILNSDETEVTIAVFDTDDLRIPPRCSVGGGVMERAGPKDLAGLLENI